MRDPARTIKSVKQAAMLLRAQTGRRGNLLELDDAEDVLVGGDMHGSINNLKRLLSLADLRNHPNRHVVLQEFVHGTGRYADGGDSSHQLLDALAAVVVQFPQQIHLLCGNHEVAELTDRQIMKDGAPLNVLFAAGVFTAYGEAAPMVSAAYAEFLQSMLLAVRTENRVLMTHSLPPLKQQAKFDVEIFDQFGLPLEEAEAGGSLYSLLWGRDTSEEAVEGFLSLMDADHLISGHIAIDSGFSVPNSRQIIVDCLGEPAGCVLFPARPFLTHDELVDCARLLSDE